MGYLISTNNSKNDSACFQVVDPGSKKLIYQSQYALGSQYTCPSLLISSKLLGIDDIACNEKRKLIAMLSHKDKATYTLVNYMEGYETVKKAKWGVCHQSNENIIRLKIISFSQLRLQALTSIHQAKKS